MRSATDVTHSGAVGDANGMSDRWLGDASESGARMAALAECPEDIRIEVESETPELRGEPEKVLGRSAEVNKIKKAVLKVTKAPKGKRTVKATALSGPPGAGKTTVLWEVKRQLEEENVKVIEMEATLITSPETFSDKVKTVDPWNREDTWKRIRDAAITGTATAGDEFISMWTTFGLKRLTSEIGEADLGPMRAALQAWRDGNTPNMSAVLKLLQNSSEKGVVIIIDEAQELVQYEKGSTRYENAATVLKQLNDPTVRAQNHLWNVTLIVAGMQDTPEIVGGLSTVRPEEIPLGPVSESIVREMIKSGIQAAPISEADQARAIEQWTDSLVQRYGDWTRHAQCAREAARVVLTHGGAKALDEPWGTALLIHTADAYRRDLCEEIISRAGLNGVNEQLQTTVMDALARNGGAIAANKMEELVARHVAAGTGQPGINLLDKTIKDERNHAIRNMKRAGQISLRDGRYISPIPSLVNHMTTERKATLEETLPVIAATGLSTADPEQPADD